MYVKGFNSFQQSIHQIKIISKAIVQISLFFINSVHLNSAKNK